MKNSKLLKLAITALTLASSACALAGDIEAGVVKRIPADERQPLMAGKTPLDLSKLASNPTISAEGQMSIQGPATGITTYRVYAVASPQGGVEYPSAYASATTYDHGGGVIQVFVLQYGYGNPYSGSLNATTVSSTSRVLCGSMSTLHYCNVGETVTGWLYEYDFYNIPAGTFKSSANSTAYPFGYWSTSIYVR